MHDRIEFAEIVDDLAEWRIRVFVDLHFEREPLWATSLVLPRAVGDAFAPLAGKARRTDHIASSIQKAVEHRRDESFCSPARLCGEPVMGDRLPNDTSNLVREVRVDRGRGIEIRTRPRELR